jgi:tryptophan-rich sensory protein
MEKINWKELLVSLAISLGVGVASALLTMNGMGQYQDMYQPPLAPPGWLFPVVWTILYVLMGISSYLILQSGEEREEIRKALTIYGYQLVVNFLWPTFFFNFGWYFFSFLWLVLLWVLVLIMILRFKDISEVAAYMNIPYLIWLTFAGYLNLGIWILNR